MHGVLLFCGALHVVVSASGFFRERVGCPSLAQAAKIWERALVACRAALARFSFATPPPWLLSCAGA
eukprot:7440529-Alexandrium_andersonii.AAC.1